jgi:hypothetical protein
LNVFLFQFIICKLYTTFKFICLSFCLSKQHKQSQKTGENIFQEWLLFMPQPFSNLIISNQSIEKLRTLKNVWIFIFDRIESKFDLASKVLGFSPACHSQCMHLINYTLEVFEAKNIYSCLVHKGRA